MDLQTGSTQSRTAPVSFVQAKAISLKRRQQSLDLLLEGCSDNEIAQKLGIKPRTVKHYLHDHFAAYGVHNKLKRVELATKAYQARRAPGELQQTKAYLTAREKQLVELAVDGWHDEAIGKQVGITMHTVKNHLRHVQDKLGLDSRLQLALWYVSHYETGIRDVDLCWWARIGV